jgi:hypothetical protein
VRYPRSVNATRLALVFVGAAACGSGDDTVDNWRGETWELDGSFSDQFGRGNDRWVVTDASALTVQYREEGAGTLDLLPSVDVGGAPAGIWASAIDDVWVAGPGLWHWDGATWSEVDLGGPATLRDVWGSAADDVWVLTADDVVLHFDGSSWSQDTPSASTLQEGCANASDDVWMRGASGLFHHDGVTWSPADAAGGVSDIFCDGQDVWLIGSEPGGAGFVHLRLGSGWELMCVSDEGAPELHHVWVPPGGGEAYVVGRTLDRVEVWDCFRGRLYSLIEGRLPGEPDDTYRGIWSNGYEIHIYGADGLVYGYLWDLE